MTFSLISLPVYQITKLIPSRSQLQVVRVLKPKSRRDFHIERAADCKMEQGWNFIFPFLRIGKEA
jgi:hypothetical protein